MTTEAAGVAVAREIETVAEARAATERAMVRTARARSMAVRAAREGAGREH